MAQKIHSLQKVRGAAIITSLFSAPEVLANWGVTLFGRRTCGERPDLGPETFDVRPWVSEPAGL